MSTNPAEVAGLCCHGLTTKPLGMSDTEDGERDWGIQENSAVGSVFLSGRSNRHFEFVQPRVAIRDHARLPESAVRLQCPDDGLVARQAAGRDLIGPRDDASGERVSLLLPAPLAAAPQ